MFDIKPGQLDIRAKYGIRDDAMVILFVGALAEYKGVNYLIRAFEIVNKAGKGAFLIIIGSGSMRKSLEEQVKASGLSEKVLFTGYVDDEEMPYFYWASDVFVLPSVSEKEGFGIVQLEAMASCKPVISSDLPGVRDVDPDGVATIHIAPANTEALADAILKLLSNPDLATSMGERGKALVMERYTWDIVAKATERIYKEVRQ
jgi:Glycosyltransferase